MKKVYIMLIALSFVLSVQAQEIVLPPSWSYHNNEVIVPSSHDLGTLDHDALWLEDTRIEEEGGRTNNGRLLFEDIDLNTHGVWNDLADGSKIWTFKFKSDNAKALSVYFDQFNMPAGSQLFIWSADKSYAEGPYDYTENNDHGMFATSEVFGDEAVLEYYQPADVIGEPVLVTRGFAHFYRYIYDFSDEWNRGGSDPCEVDVKCPEGLGHEGMRDATVRLRIVDGEFVGLCTGVLVNTTARDCRQYMLTALHCADNVSTEDFSVLQVRFNYEKTGCAFGGAPSTHQRTGVFFLADSNDGGGNSGSDFLLVEIEDDISETWKPFYAGWDASGPGGNEGVCTHHPAGDVKKISTYDAPLTSEWWGAPGSHWGVHWIETETNHGVTEGGSSGSPLWNVNDQIVGTLTGGLSFCTAPNDPDFYGKMSYHWDMNSNPTDDLKDWLDPDGTGEEVLFGNYAPNCDTEWVGVTEIEFGDLGVYPNPATSEITFEFKKDFALSQVSVYDAMGHLVSTIALNANQKTLNISSLKAGVYFFTFTTTHDQQITKKVTVL